MKTTIILGLLCWVGACGTVPPRKQSEQPQIDPSREACLQACNRKAHRATQSWRTGDMTLGDRPHQIQQQRPLATDSERLKALFKECVRKRRCEKLL